MIKIVTKDFRENESILIQGNKLYKYDDNSYSGVYDDVKDIDIHLIPEGVKIYPDAEFDIKNIGCFVFREFQNVKGSIWLSFDFIDWNLEPAFIIDDLYYSLKICF